MILHRLSSVLLCSTLVSIATGAPAPLHPRDSLRRRAASAAAPVDLGSAINYVILSQAEITTVPTSHIVGDIGASPESQTAITGFSLVLDSSGSFATSSQVSGKVFAADYTSPTPATLTRAINDANAAYGRAALEFPPDFIELGGGAIGGLTLTPGIYKWSTGVVIGSDITLSGPCDAVFIFQISGLLTQAALSQINLVGGVLASRIYWQTTGGVTIGQGATFEGIILSAMDVLLNTGSSMTGRIFSSKIVTLDMASLYRPQPYDPAWCAIVTVTEVLPGSTATVSGAVVTLAPVTNVFTTTAAGAIETDWLTLWQTSTSIEFVPTVTTVTLPTTLVVLETMTATGAAAAAVTLTSTAVSTWTTMVAGPAVTQVVTSTEWLHDTVVSTVVQPATTFVTTLGPVVTSLSTVFANAATTVVSDVISTMTWTEVSTVTMPAASDLTTMFVPIQRIVLQTITAPASVQTMWLTTTMLVKETVVPTAGVGVVNTVSVPTTLISVVSTQVPVATSIITFLSTGPAVQPTPTTPPAGPIVGGPSPTPIAASPVAGGNSPGPIVPIPSPTVVAGGGTPANTPSNGQGTNGGNQVPPVAGASASASASASGGGGGTNTGNGIDTNAGNGNGNGNGNGGGNNENNNNGNGNIVTTTMFVPTTIYASPTTIYMTPTTVYASSTTVTETVASTTLTTGFPVFPFYPTSVPSIPSSETDVVNYFTFPSFPTTTVSTVGAECTASVAQAAYSAAASAAYNAGVAAASAAASVAASVCPNPEPTAGLDQGNPITVNFQQTSSAPSPAIGTSWGLVISAVSFLFLFL